MQTAPPRLEAVMQLGHFRSRPVAAAMAACLAIGALTGGPAVAVPVLANTASAAGAAPAQGALFSVAATSASDAWAVGFRFGGQADRTLIEHWDGRSWKQVKSPSPGGPGHDAELLGVTAISRNNAWPVGFFSDGTFSHSLVEHWNGRSWAHVPSPAPVKAPGDPPDVGGGGNSVERMGQSAPSRTSSPAMTPPTRSTGTATTGRKWSPRTRAASWAAHCSG